jgi:hypothetical protein
MPGQVHNIIKEDVSFRFHLLQIHGIVNLKYDRRMLANLKYLLSIFRPNG